MRNSEVISMVEIPFLCGMEKSQPSSSMYRNKDIVKEGITLEENVREILVKVKKPKGLHLQKNLPKSPPNLLITLPTTKGHMKL